MVLNKNQEFNSSDAALLVAIKNFENVYDIYEVVKEKEDKMNKKNNKKSKSKLRMNLVRAHVFEDAMRDCHVHWFQLTYVYVYPRNCRMLIGIPVYQGGYIHNKNEKNRQISF
ncbi:hypothetical protein MAR_019392 [Mya arenaria]|uniref:Uncharacterized protein n=1 Tax=Mya arenaria TaxID=6604 RepID=A0ABY7EJV2_MYAAR|nr:hypothetical protein MAR_019392 [Mya arenaria]